MTPAQLDRLVSLKRREVDGRALMSFPVDSEQDHEAQQELAQELRQLPGERIYQSPTTGLQLPVDSNFPARMLYYFLLGDYEEHDMRLIRMHVRPGSTALELGGGIGLTGSLLGQVTGNTVTVCEPNAALLPLIERTFRANAAGLDLVNAAVVREDHAGDNVVLHRSDEYWWSSLVAMPGATQVEVRPITLTALLERSGADVVVVDIEGYESELLADAPLDQVKTLLVEIHTPSIGTEATGAVVTHLIHSGFRLADIGGHTFVFRRD